MEKLEILNMIKEGTVSPEQGVRLIEALEKSEKKDQDRSAPEGHGKWIKIEVRTKHGGKFKSLTPIRIPFSLIKLFFRFIPKESSLLGHEYNFEEGLNHLQAGEPIDLHSEKDGRAIRISVE